MHDPLDGGSWSAYYTCSTGPGIGCKIHGEWDGSRFVPPNPPAATGAASGAAPGEDRAFAKERAAADSKFEPLERIPIGGPVSTDALGLDASVSEVTLVTDRDHIARRHGEEADKRMVERKRAEAAEAALLAARRGALEEAAAEVLRPPEVQTLTRGAGFAVTTRVQRSVQEIATAIRSLQESP